MRGSDTGAARPKAADAATRTKIDWKCMVTV